MSSVDELLEMKSSVSAPITSDGAAASASSPAQEIVYWNETEYCLYRFEKSASHHGGKTSAHVITLIGTSCAPDTEKRIRKPFFEKFQHGPHYPGSGQVTSLDIITFPPSSQLYYCLIEGPAKTPNTTPTHSSHTTEANVHAKRQYFICFLQVAKSGLELFRTDLDGFCSMLKDHLPDESTHDHKVQFRGSEFEKLVDNWYIEQIEYIARVMKICHSVLPSLLHVAVNSLVEVTGPNKRNVKDVKMFLNACSLASMMKFTDDKSPQRNVTITVSDVDCNLSCCEVSQFCLDWAQVLLAQGNTHPDPFFLRQAVENYKLKIVQDLNAFKRLLREAESDYHALYRCYLFLCVCGNGRLLLQCATQEATALLQERSVMQQTSVTSNSASLSVLSILKTFSEKNGFKKLINRN